MNDALKLRHSLHAYPDLSGAEQATAARIRDFFVPLEPDTVISELGGSGVAFVFDSGAAGDTLMLRCELDALPVQESVDLPWRSTRNGVSHKCGHDGHMAILATVGERLARQRPATGRVVLLFQPAEETGVGAQQVTADPQFSRIRPDLVFGLHNVPGFPLGQIIVRDGTFSCASRGMIVRLTGKAAHAAQPETGVSPAATVSRLLDASDNIASTLTTDELVLATVVGVSMGGRNFGMAPGTAEICVTLRAETDATMSGLVQHFEALVRSEAERRDLQFNIRYQDVFDATVNSPAAVNIVRQAAAGLPLAEATEPFRWSEDFGRFTQLGDGAFFGLGAGESVPALHNDDYDFPDALIQQGADVFLNIIDVCLGRNDHD
ncbi:MAG: amidohydrolase [Woeseia sp.]